MNEHPSLWLIFTRTFFAVALFVLCAGELPGQNSTGSITINAVDASGAAVPGAAVVITGTHTGVQLRSLKTNGQGIADVPLVPPGRYNVEVALQGFKDPYQQQNLIDDPAQKQLIARFDLLIAAWLKEFNDPFDFAAALRQRSAEPA